MAKKVQKKKQQKRISTKKPIVKKVVKKEKLNHPFEIGKMYIIRTVTMYILGRIVEVFEKELVLQECSWIPDTGRWSNALNTGDLNEIEPYIQSESVIIGRGSLVDCQVWKHDVKNQVK
jgi:hypothetical protein